MQLQRSLCRPCPAHPGGSLGSRCAAGSPPVPPGWGGRWQRRGSCLQVRGRLARWGRKAGGRGAQTATVLCVHIGSTTAALWSRCCSLCANQYRTHPCHTQQGLPLLARASTQQPSKNKPNRPPTQQEQAKSPSHPPTHPHDPPVMRCRVVSVNRRPPFCCTSWRARCSSSRPRTAARVK